VRDDHKPGQHGATKDGVVGRLEFSDLELSYSVRKFSSVPNVTGRETQCRMVLPGPTTSVGARTDYSVGPWDYLTWAAWHLLAWSTRISVEKYSDRKLRMSCTM
jgi:hypothetical protein